MRLLNFVSITFVCFIILKTTISKNVAKPKNYFSPIAENLINSQNYNNDAIQLDLSSSGEY